MLFSNSETALETVGWVTFIWRAAWVKLPVRATARK